MKGSRSKSTPKPDPKGQKPLPSDAGTLEKEKEKAAKQERILKKALIAAFIIVGLIFVGGLITATVLYYLPSDRDTYQSAMDYLDQGRYTNAYNLFVQLGDYKDSKKQAEDIAMKLIGKKEGYFVTSEGAPYYTMTDGAISFNRDYSNQSGRLVIPDAVDNVPVTAIAESAFTSCTWLTEITFPDAVRSVGKEAFRGCTSLKAVHFGSSLRTISTSAFERCSALESVDLPDSLTAIDSSAFYGCTSLKSVRIPKGISVIRERVFYQCTSLEQVEFSGKIREIEPYAFSLCSSLKSVDLPADLTKIYASAFANCTALTQIVIPDKVESIDSRAFEGCRSLTEVTLGAGITALRAYLFTGCSSLTAISLPASLKNIEGGVFSGCDALSEVRFAGSEADYAAISVGDNNQPLKDAKVQFGQ